MQEVVPFFYLYQGSVLIYIVRAEKFHFFFFITAFGHL